MILVFGIFLRINVQQSSSVVSDQDILGILIAALGGLAVGLERQWSGHATGPKKRFAGVRTFTLLGILSGISGWLWINHFELVSAILLAAGAALVVAAYAAASRHDVEATTEVAALVVLTAGVAAGIGSLALAAGAIAVITLLLVEKSRIHDIARLRTMCREIRAGPKRPRRASHACGPTRFAQPVRG